MIDDDDDEETDESTATNDTDFIIARLEIAQPVIRSVSSNYSIFIIYNLFIYIQYMYSIFKALNTKLRGRDPLLLMKSKY